jgi:deoxyribodipyrimidine photolyase-like uncharacterized protein
MQHFRDEQCAAGRQVFYSELDDLANRGSFAADVRRRAAEINPQRLILLEHGDWRVQEQLGTLGLHLEINPPRTGRSREALRAARRSFSIADCPNQILARRLGRAVEAGPSLLGSDRHDAR